MNRSQNSHESNEIFPGQSFDVDDFTTTLDDDFSKDDAMLQMEIFTHRKAAFGDDLYALDEFHDFTGDDWN